MKYNSFFQKFVAYLFILGMLVSCNQYNALPYSDASAPTIDNLVVDADGNVRSENIIFHSNGKTFKLSDASSDKTSATGKLVAYDLEMASDYSATIANQYVALDRTDDEAYSHVFDPSNSLSEGDEVMISVDEETGALVLKQKTGEVWKVLLGALVVILALIGGMFIFLLIACNCPHAYVFDGKEYKYTNTLFTGATAPNLERDDYKIMEDFLKESNSYKMIIKNEDNESHFLNLLELMVISHDKNVEVIPDQKGKIHSISNLVSAAEMVSENGDNLLNMVSSRDDLAFSFDSQSNENMVHAFATFEKPTDVSNAKVVLKLKNSQWGGLVYKTFASMMGDKYEGWVEKNHKRSSEEAKEAMKKAGIPLVLSVKKGEEWIDIETIDLIGEVDYNTLTISIDESLLTDDEITLRIKGGFKFWDLDYIGMDFSAQQELDIQVIKPTMDELDASKSIALENDDELYLEHLMTGDSTYFKFNGLNTSAEARTIIMHSKGYYLSKDEYAGNPNWKQLMKLRAPGGLSRLSKELFESYENLVLAPN